MRPLLSHLSCCFSPSSAAAVGVVVAGAAGPQDKKDADVSSPFLATLSSLTSLVFFFPYGVAVVVVVVNVAGQAGHGRFRAPRV